MAVLTGAHVQTQAVEALGRAGGAFSGSTRKAEQANLISQHTSEVPIADCLGTLFFSAQPVRE